MHNDIDILQWWGNSGLILKYSHFAIDFASQKGYLKVLDWWKNREKLTLKYSDDAMDHASEEGLLDVLNWWLYSGLSLKYSRYALNIASKNG